jgi:hypothetical protein
MKNIDYIVLNVFFVTPSSLNSFQILQVRSKITVNIKQWLCLKVDHFILVLPNVFT